jgi:hypothetical protein
MKKVSGSTTADVGWALDTEYPVPFLSSGICTLSD